MIENIEFIYKILFLIFLPNTNGPLFNIEIFGMEVEDIKFTLYIAYYLIVVWGLVITRRKSDIF